MDGIANPIVAKEFGDAKIEFEEKEHGRPHGQKEIKKNEMSGNEMK